MNICLHCSKQFVGRPERPNKFCSHECHVESSKTQVTKKCLVCGNEFSGYESRQVCSLACVHQQMRLAERPCARCAKMFPPEKSKSKYCSWNCLILDKTTRSIQEPDPIPGAKYVSLSKNEWAIVDEEDSEKVSEYVWQARIGKNTIYAVTRKITDGITYFIRLHHLVLDIPPGGKTIVDHIDLNGRNCRKSNLRIASKSQNRMNTVKKRGQTPYKGVALLPSGKFKATVRAYGKTEYLGTFHSAEEAALAFDTAARRIHGKFGRYNFPNLDERSAAKIKTD